MKAISGRDIEVWEKHGFHGLTRMKVAKICAIRAKVRGQSGGGPPQSKTRGVCLRLTNRAKRPGVRQSSGAFGRAENLERWMISVRTKSGAEVTAVQTLREFRSVAAFGRKPPSEK
jgi:hypothetical protein